VAFSGTAKTTPNAQEDHWNPPKLKNGKVIHELDPKQANYIKKQIPLAKWHLWDTDEVFQKGEVGTILEGVVMFCPKCGPVAIPAGNIIRVNVDKNKEYAMHVGAAYAKGMSDTLGPTNMYAKVHLHKTHLDLHYRCDGCGLILIARMVIHQED